MGRTIKAIIREPGTEHIAGLRFEKPDLKINRNGIDLQYVDSVLKIGGPKKFESFFEHIVSQFKEKDAIVSRQETGNRVTFTLIGLSLIDFGGRWNVLTLIKSFKTEFTPKLGRLIS